MSTKLRIAVLEDEVLALLKVARAILSSDPALDRHDILAMLFNANLSESAVDQARRDIESEINEERAALGQSTVLFPPVCTELQRMNPGLPEDRIRIVDYLENRDVDLILTDARMGDPADPLAGCFLLQEASRRLRWKYNPRNLCVMTQYPELKALFRDHGREDITLDFANHFDKEELLRVAADEVHPRLDAVLNFALNAKRRSAAAAASDEFCGIVGKSQRMINVYEEVQRYAPEYASVLIVGETGTGKELVARALHALSGRKGKFVPVEQKSLGPEGLMQTEVFGRKKGAYTGADTDMDGVLSRANNGTFFLDEIQNLSEEFQQMMLRVLEGKKFRKIGGKEQESLDVRFVCATNVDPEHLRREGRLRDDFFFRVSQRVIRLPPLRDRAEDIPLLVLHFIRNINENSARSIKEEVSEMALRTLQSYSWPGNVRELNHLVERVASETADHDGIDANGSAFAELRERASLSEAAIHRSGEVPVSATGFASGADLRGYTADQIARWVLRRQSPLRPETLVELTDEATAGAAIERLREILKARKPDDGRRVNEYLKTEFPKYIKMSYGGLRNWLSDRSKGAKRERDETVEGS